MKFRRNLLLSLTTLSAPIIPVALIVSCGEANIKNVSKNVFLNAKTIAALSLDFSKLKDLNWPTYNSIFNDHMYAVDDKYFNIFNNKSFETKGMQFYESTFEINKDSLKAKNYPNQDVLAKTFASDIHLSLFKPGQNFSILNSKAGISIGSKLSEMKNADSFDFLTTVTPHTLSEGGMINLDLYIKDGKIYNPMSTNAFGEVDTPILGSNLKMPTRATIVFDQNNIPSVVQLPVFDNEIYSLKLFSNGKDYDAVERKNINAFDFRNKYDHNVVKVKQYEDMKDGEVRVLTGMHQENAVKNIDLVKNNLTAYRVIASDNLNGITTVDNFLNIFSDKTINQAPFEGVVAAEDDSSTDFSTTPGEAIILVKNSKNLFKVGDKINASYEFTDNPKYTDVINKLKNSKYAFSEIDYGGNRLIMDSWRSEFEKQFPEENIFRFADGNNVNRLSASSHVIRDGNVWAFPGQGLNIDQWRSLDSLARQYFVIMDDGRWGFVSFSKNQFSDFGIHHITLPTIMKTLGAKELVAMDGGGSVQQYINSDDSWKGFPESSDPGNSRAMTLGFAVRGKDE